MVLILTSMQFYLLVAMEHIHDTVRLLQVLTPYKIRKIH
jgi:hypothetical protein